MSVLALSAGLVALSMQCAPTVAPGTLLTFAKAESGLDPLALHDNSAGASLHAGTKDAAIVMASRLISAGHSVDIGALQINSRNLAWLGMSLTQAFELCPSMRAGARVLHAAFDPCVDAGGEAQHCLAVAASQYNTGSQSRGFSNGYVTRIAETAEHFIPELRVAGALPQPLPAQPPVPPSPPPCAPPWDGWALAACSTAATPPSPEPQK